MQMKIRKSFILLFSAVIAVLLLACVFMFTPKTTAHADTEETHDHSTMTEINSYADIEDGELTAGAYVLTNNIDGNISVRGTVTLCLNGHTVTGDGTDTVIYVSNGAMFTLCDCQGTGIIMGGNTELNGGGIYVAGGAFIMTGGTISGNTAGGKGGAVHVGGTFKMSGGVISENTASGGGGVFLYFGTFEMTGSTISGNTADLGGGVYASDGTLKLSGAPNITDNKDKNNADNNVFLYEADRINVTGTFNEGAQIGITVGVVNYDEDDDDEIKELINESVEFATGFKYNGSDKPSKYFIPDNPENCVYVSDKTEGAVTIGTHDFAEELTSDETSHWYECQNGCGKFAYAYSHNYNQEVVNDIYLKSAATCNAKAVYYKSCECGVHGTETFEYGEALGHTLTHHEATAATEEKEGNTEYWSCDKCDKYFSDAAGETEITDKSSVTLPKLTPDTPETPSAPAEDDKSYVWISWLLIPFVIAGGGVTLGILVYKKKL